MIVVELPPEGFSSWKGQESTASSCSMVRKIDNLNMKTDDSSACSFDSSYVSVFSFEGLLGLPSEDESASSSWSHVPSQPTSVSSAGWTSTSASTSVGSIVSNFDILSLPAGGETIRRCCKRCKYHNTPESAICDSCDLALVTNPCLDIDERIARNLQEKEETEALLLLNQEQQKRSRLYHESVFVQASFLRNEIRACVRQAEFRSKGFGVLSKYDLIF
jgi:hypothetical protein